MVNRMWETLQEWLSVEGVSSNLLTSGYLVNLNLYSSPGFVSCVS